MSLCIITTTAAHKDSTLLSQAVSKVEIEYNKEQQKYLGQQRTAQGKR